MARLGLRKLAFYTTCGLCSRARGTPVKIPEEWPQPSPKTCKCGNKEPVYEYTDLFRPVRYHFLIGYITWIPCPLHPCEHSPSVEDTVASTGTDRSTSAVTEETACESMIAQKCLCSKQAQIDLDPELKELQAEYSVVRDVW